MRDLMWTTIALCALGCGTDDLSTAELRFVGDEGEVALGADGRAPWMWGFQGGAMIQPVLVLPPDAGYAAGDRVSLRITHAPDPEAPEMFSVAHDHRALEVDAEVEARDGLLVTTPVPDQLGWGALDGTRLLLRIELAGVADLEHRLTLYRQPDPCAAWVTGGSGCGYAQIPGTYHVVGFDRADDACGTPAVALSGWFEPSPEAAECAALAVATTLDEGTVMPGPEASRACFDGLSVGVGSTLPASAHFMFRGTCGPDLYAEVELDTSACGCD